MVNEEVKRAYEDYAAECESGGNITVTRIENVKRSLVKSEGRKVIESIKSREKTFDKVVEKCIRKGYANTEEDINMDIIKKKVQDVYGIRIITTYEDDIYKVVKILHQIPGINIDPDDEVDYVNNPKANGYSSYHLIARVEVYSHANGGSKLVPIEIQIRDLGMDYWAAVEHEIKYKNSCPPPEAEAKFKQIAELLSAVRKEMIDLRELTKNPAN